jgi:hypothetical protein
MLTKWAIATGKATMSLRCKLGRHKYDKESWRSNNSSRKWHGITNWVGACVWTLDIPYCWRCEMYITPPITEEWIDKTIIGKDKPTDAEQAMKRDAYLMGYNDGKGDNETT